MRRPDGLAMAEESALLGAAVSAQRQRDVGSTPEAGNAPHGAA